MRCIVIRGDAWLVLLSPCNTQITALQMIPPGTCLAAARTQAHLHVLRSNHAQRRYANWPSSPLYSRRFKGRTCCSEGVHVGVGFSTQSFAYVWSCNWPWIRTTGSVNVWHNPCVYESTITLLQDCNCEQLSLRVRLEELQQTVQDAQSLLS